jgi:YidC/Oxa1 family membrane protein insertase
VSYLYHIILYQPLLNVLVFFYNTIAFHDFGLAVIFLTILVRLILFPIYQKSLRHQTIMQELQPRVAKIQELHKSNKEQQSRALLDLYKEHNINPFSGFLFLLIQLPILFAVYGIFLQSFTPDFFKDLYGFVAQPAVFNTTFFGLINLSKGSIVVVVLAAFAQYYQGRMTIKKPAPGVELTAADRMARNMLYIAPAITILIFMRLPAALSLYWLITSLISIGQQALVIKQRDHGKLGCIPPKTD